LQGAAPDQCNNPLRGRARSSTPKQALRRWWDAPRDDRRPIPRPPLKAGDRPAVSGSLPARGSQVEPGGAADPGCRRRSKARRKAQHGAAHRGGAKKVAGLAQGSPVQIALKALEKI